MCEKDFFSKSADVVEHLKINANFLSKINEEGKKHLENLHQFLEEAKSGLDQKKLNDCLFCHLPYVKEMISLLEQATNLLDKSLFQDGKGLSDYLKRIQNFYSKYEFLSRDKSPKKEEE